MNGSRPRYKWKDPTGGASSRIFNLFRSLVLYALHATHYGIAHTENVHSDQPDHYSGETSKESDLGPFARFVTRFFRPSKVATIIAGIHACRINDPHDPKGQATEDRGQN